MPSATRTRKTTGFDCPAASSKGCSAGVSRRAWRESPVRASKSSRRTFPASAPVERLPTFTGISITSPSRRNRGTTGSTMRSLAATAVSRSVPERRLASWASDLNCQVVSVSGRVNSIVTLPSSLLVRAGRKNAVSTRFFRGGGGAAAAVFAAGGGPPPSPTAAKSISRPRATGAPLAIARPGAASAIIASAIIGAAIGIAPRIIPRRLNPKNCIDWGPNGSRNRRKLTSTGTCGTTQLPTICWRTSARLLNSVFTVEDSWRKSPERPGGQASGARASSDWS